MALSEFAIPPYIVPLSIQAIEIIHYLLSEIKLGQTHLLAHRSDLKNASARTH